MVSLHYHWREIWQLFAWISAFSAIPKDINGNNVFCDIVTSSVVEGRELLGSQHVCRDNSRIIRGQV